MTVPTFLDTRDNIAIYVALGLICDSVFYAWDFEKSTSMNYSIDVHLDQEFEVRNPSNGSYIVFVKNGVEPDSKSLGKNVYEVDYCGHTGMTLLERMLLELFHFEKTGKHLDIDGGTLCSGSRSLDGRVPDVFYSSDWKKVRVVMSTLGHNREKCGIREVSLVPF